MYYASIKPSNCVDCNIFHANILLKLQSNKTENLQAYQMHSVESRTEKKKSNHSHCKRSNSETHLVLSQELRFSICVPQTELHIEPCCPRWRVGRRRPQRWLQERTLRLSEACSSRPSPNHSRNAHGKKHVCRKCCPTRAAACLSPEQGTLAVLAPPGKKRTPTSSKAPVWKNFRGFSIA